MSSIFKLAKNAPRRADFKGRGIIQLDSISDELALELAKEGCEYIVLTPEGKKLLKPVKEIQVKKTPNTKTPKKTTTKTGKVNR